MGGVPQELDGREEQAMAITNPQAVDFGYLVAFAEGMYVPGSIKPLDQGRAAAAGWDIVGHLIALDSILPPMSSLGPNDAKALRLGDQLVFYGYLARNHGDPTRYAAAVRGTIGFAEWVIDADFFLRDAPSSPGAKVEQGFWSVYDSMTLVGLDGVQIGAKAADGIANQVGQGSVTICGHSLGSAVATYLSFDVAKLLGAKASACLFASPRTGDLAWTTAYAATVATCRLMNYILDVVPYVPLDAPPAFQYSTLPMAEIILPSAAQAEVRFDLVCDHNVICYCAMIDYADTKARESALDASSWRCIVGPPAFSLNRDLTVALGVAMEALDDAGRDIVRLVSASARAKGGHV
jgi:triacylglycerol lipase